MILADYRKIRIMSALAVYDKYYGEKDREIMSYHKWDYVYKKNSATRIFVFFGCVILLGLYYLNMIFVNSLLLDFDNINGMVLQSVIIVALVLAAYTVLGTFIYAKAYDRTVKRYTGYLKLLEVLDNEAVTPQGNGKDVTWNS